LVTFARHEFPSVFRFHSAFNDEFHVLPLATGLADTAVMMACLVSGSRLFWLLPKLTASLSPHERGTDAARGERLFCFDVLFLLRHCRRCLSLCLAAMLLPSSAFGGGHPENFPTGQAAILS